MSPSSANRSGEKKGTFLINGRCRNQECPFLRFCGGWAFWLLRAFPLAVTGPRVSRHGFTRRALDRRELRPSAVGQQFTALGVAGLAVGAEGVRAVRLRDAVLEAHPHGGGVADVLDVHSANSFDPRRTAG
jgi:hypothetical protein